MDNLKIDLRKKIKLDINKNFITSCEALESLGYTKNKVLLYKNVYYPIFKDNTGKLFAYRGAKHFGGYFYNVVISPVIS